MVRYLLIASVVLFFLACRPDVTQPTLVVNGLLIDQQPLRIELSALRDFEAVPTDGATVVCRFENNGQEEEYVLEPQPDNPTVYIAPEGAPLIEAGLSYTLSATWEGTTARAAVTVPEPISFIQISNTSIPVDPASQGQPVFSVLWEASPGFSRVFTLTEPSDNPVEIPFGLPAGRFAEQFRLPIPGQGTTLWDIDFRYYGTHELGIYTIDREFESLFFYTPGEGGARLTRGPSNVENGAGVVAGASFTTIEIEILQ